MADLPKWITPKQASAILGRSQSWLYRAREGKHAGPPFYRPGYRILYKEDEVLRFLELRRSECPAPKKE